MFQRLISVAAATSRTTWIWSTRDAGSQQQQNNAGDVH